jgi:HSP20 family protein
LLEVLTGEPDGTRECVRREAHVEGAAEIDNDRRVAVDDMFNRIFGDAWQPSRRDQGEGTPTWWPAVECYGQNGIFCLRVALPGVDPKDVDVSVTDQTLIIKGSRKAAHEGQEGDYFRREFGYGSFERAFPIPEGVDPGQVSAKYANGMLEISVPAPQLSAPKKIAIEVDGQAAARKQIKA